MFSWITLINCFACTIDYIFYIAISISLFFSNEKDKKWNIPTLYYFTGFSLCWVAIEKLIYLLMAIDVVVKHEVPTFGFSLFIDILNRTLAVAITIIFILTTLIFGILEIVGHIVLIVFLIEGTTHYPLLISRCKTRKQKIIFIVSSFFLGLFTMVFLYHRFT
ncbi:hypothetical protein [Bacillus sp. AR18-7]|uniref:hypothetical protein n=1 Tax=Bacillus sp. AR18-7 TaxID=2217821 RepID=UPI0011CCDF3E|nr:hypothetical protein [Bacillus sp. AR18-7]TXR68244.1 hypothetical protein DN395_00420 [Bacillus sp. AR18-7]